MRAVIRAGSVTLVPAEFATVRGGPGACLARAALDPSVSIADLEFGEDDEDDELDAELEDEDAPTEPDAAEDRDLEVRFLANDLPAARRTLRHWAARAGHGRVWFRDQVVDLEPPAELDGEFATTCSDLRPRDRRLRPRADEVRSRGRPLPVELLRLRHVRPAVGTGPRSCPGGANRKTRPWWSGGAASPRRRGLSRRRRRIPAGATKDFFATGSAGAARPTSGSSRSAERER